MIKELLINGQVNRYTLSNRARQAIAFQYITDTKTLRLIDTWNNVAVDIVDGGDNALTSSAMQKVWQYIEDRINSKTEGAFHFRGTAEADENGKPNVQNPKAGDVYQVTVETGQYDPNTGQLIPSTVVLNDKEFAWAEKEDGTGQWVELGLNFDPGQGIIDKDWIEQFVETKQQAALEHEAISSFISTTAQQLYSYIDQHSSSSDQYIETVSANIMNYVNNTVSTSIVQLIDNKVNTISGQLDQIKEQIETTGDETTQVIQSLSTLFEQKYDEIAANIETFSGSILDRMDTISGGFITRDEQNQQISQLTQQMEENMSFITYDDEGNIITP